jgi:hypothetical protein
VAVNDVWLEFSEDAEEAHGCADHGTLANDVNMDAFRAKHLKQWAGVGIDTDRDVVPVGALYPAKLGYKRLRTSHLKTVDNVDDFHGSESGLGGRF